MAEKKIKITEVSNEELAKLLGMTAEGDGKVVVVLARYKSGEELPLVSDYKCMYDNDKSGVCDGCQLRFECYLSMWLKIDAEDLNPNNIGQTMNEKVKAYIERKRGVPDKKVDIQ